jgi:hypothetical protein
MVSTFTIYTLLNHGQYFHHLHITEPWSVLLTSTHCWTMVSTFTIYTFQNHGQYFHHQHIAEPWSVLSPSTHCWTMVSTFTIYTLQNHVQYFHHLHIAEPWSALSPSTHYRTMVSSCHLPTHNTDGVGQNHKDTLYMAVYWFVPWQKCRVCTVYICGSGQPYKHPLY